MRLFLGKKRSIGISASIQFEPRDLWVGVYWDAHDLGAIRSLKVYICVLPMLPLRLYIGRVNLRKG